MKKIEFKKLSWLKGLNLNLLREFITKFSEEDGVDLRVCLSGASYAAAEKGERRMALKI